MERISTLLAVLLLVALFGAAAPASSASASMGVLSPSMAMNSAVYAYGPNGTLVPPNPPMASARYMGEVDVLLNWFTALFPPDPATYRYRVVSTTYELSPQLPPYVNLSSGSVAISITPVVSANAYATRPWYFFGLEEHAKVYATVDLSIRYLDPPASPGRYDVGQAIAQAVGSRSLSLKATVVVERVTPDPATFTVDVTAELSLDGLYLDLYLLSASNVAFSQSGVKVEEPQDTGYFGVYPSGTLSLTISLSGPDPGFRVSGTAYLSQMGRQLGSAQFTVSPQSPASLSFRDIPMVPGNYTGGGVEVQVEAGGLRIPIQVPLEVRGAAAYMTIPSVAVVESYGGFNATVSFTAYLASYPPGQQYSATASATVSLLGQTLQCSANLSSGETGYSAYPARCSSRVYSQVPGDAQRVAADVVLSIYIGAEGGSYRYIGNAYIIRSLGYSSLVASAYEVTVRALLAVITAAAALYMVSQLYPGFLPIAGELIDRIPVLAVVLVFTVAAPYIAAAFLSLAARLPDLGPWIAAGPTGSPENLFAVPPDMAVRLMAAAYEVSLAEVRSMLTVDAPSRISSIGYAGVVMPLAAAGFTVAMAFALGMLGRAYILYPSVIVISTMVFNYVGLILSLSVATAAAVSFSMALEALMAAVAVAAFASPIALAILVLSPREGWLEAAASFAITSFVLLPAGGPITYAAMHAVIAAVDPLVISISRASDILGALNSAIALLLITRGGPMFLGPAGAFLAFHELAALTAILAYSGIATALAAGFHVAAALSTVFLQPIGRVFSQIIGR